MEVHHHSHTARKKWTHYFWEFLMLFLAVFCGFLAENQREHFVEGNRASEYAKSLLNDLDEDIVELRNAIEYQVFLISAIDSIQAILFANQQERDYPETLYFYCRFSTHSYPVDWNSSTINQLIQSGNLRFFKNKKLVKTVNKYYAIQQTINRIDVTDAVHRDKIREIRNQIVEFRYHTPYQNLSVDSIIRNGIPSVMLDSLKRKRVRLQLYGEKYLSTFLNHITDRKARFKTSVLRWYTDAIKLSEEIRALLINEYDLN